MWGREEEEEKGGGWKREEGGGGRGGEGSVDSQSEIYCRQLHHSYLEIDGGVPPTTSHTRIHTHTHLSETCRIFLHFTPETFQPSSFL